MYACISNECLDILTRWRSFAGSDGWAVRPDVVQNVEEAAAGGMSIKLYSPPITDFDRHYWSLRPNTNLRNPWFREFWQEKFKCYLQGEDRDERYAAACTGMVAFLNLVDQDQIIQTKIFRIG